MTKFSESLFDIEEFPNIVGEFYQALILITTYCLSAIICRSDQNILQDFLKQSNRDIDCYVRKHIQLK